MTPSVSPADGPFGEPGKALASWIGGNSFSCLGARTALRRNLLREVTIDWEIGDSRAVSLLHRALLELSRTITESAGTFASLVAVFAGPQELSEDQFETLLWRQLGELRAIDHAQGYEWAADVDNDPRSPRFAFSVAAHPFFVVGLHPGSSRISRRFPKPALAFNSHHQFRRLKSQGIYAGLQRRIREREVRLQGDINPNLAEHGDMSEALQYSGKPNDLSWSCPVAWFSDDNPDEQERGE